MDVIHMVAVILLIPDQMFPIMTLPDAPLRRVWLRRSVTGKAREKWLLISRQRRGKSVSPSGKERMQWRWSGNTTQAWMAKG